MMYLYSQDLAHLEHNFQDIIEAKQKEAHALYLDDIANASIQKEDGTVSGKHYYTIKIGDICLSTTAAMYPGEDGGDIPPIYQAIVNALNERR